MSGKKKIRTRGKIQFSRYFQELKEGDSVAVVKEPSVRASFPERLQGRTGVVEGKRGRAYIIKIKDQNKEKKILINPIHLKKIKLLESKTK
jgi:large subunit ribosomal protein L21e